ncbi:STAS domain-containing protein [Actinoplanes sp. CA-252034]|uniref:STAS domain-containing protein n=1 Tax=Actinoplanes sp. CA-252034 TaxID=3239906 RepID=UPI003D970850
MTSYLPSNAPRLSVEARTLASPTSGAVVVSLAGEVDRVSGPEVQRVIEDALERHRPQRICLDMQQVTFLDSSGIRTLLICRRHALRRRCKLEISRAHDNVRQVLSITALLKVFHLEDGSTQQSYR